MTRLRFLLVSFFGAVAAVLGWKPKPPVIAGLDPAFGPDATVVYTVEKLGDWRFPKQGWCLVVPNGTQLTRASLPIQPRPPLPAA